jgi:cytochrome c oxidase cbb3-type subunit III
VGTLEALMHRNIIAAACLAALLTAAGCDAPPEDRVPAEAVRPPGLSSELPRVPVPFLLTEEQELGRELYEALCWTCHGMSGRGDGPSVVAGSVPRPPDFTAGEYPRLTGADLEATFRGLVEDRDPIHPYMRLVQGTVEPEAFLKALHYVPVVGYPPEVPGSAFAGRERYARHCSACHGYQGRGDGRLVQGGLLLIPPPDFTTDTLIARGDFDALFRRVKEGGAPAHVSSMPAWRVLFSDPQIWDLVAFIATFQPDVLSPPAESRAPH